MPNVADLLLGGGSKGGANERPFDLLTEHWNFDMMNRRAGGLDRPGRLNRHADSHKYCSLGRCGTRPGPYEADSTKGWQKTPWKAKVTSWRKAKALANRRYLEEYVYAAKE